MSRTLPTRRTHENPDLDQLKRQAKELLRTFLAEEPEATAEVETHYTGADRATFALHDAQLVLARGYGFESWPKLKAYVLGRSDPNVTGGLGRTLLHEVAAMRDHITEEETAGFAEALLNAGAKVGGRDEMLKSTALGWACRWGRVSAARLMLEYGADPLEPDAEPWARPRAWRKNRGTQKLWISCASTAAD